jgi:N-acetylneuraminic acid mutarotase
MNRSRWISNVVFSAAGILFIGTTVAMAQSPFDWNTVTSMSTARQTFGAARGGDGHIYAVGGDAGTGNTVEAYNPDTNMWSPAPSFPTPRSSFAVTAGLDGKIYVIGGFGPNGKNNLVEVFDPQNNTWTRLPDMPTSRHGLAATTGMDGKIYALGGIGSNGDTKVVEAYDPQTNAWAQITPMNVTHSLFAAATTPDGRIFAISGINSFDPNNASSAYVEAYDPRTKIWSPVSQMNNGRFEFAATVGSDGQIYAVGGNGLTIPAPPATPPFVEVYDPINDTWTVLSPTLNSNVADEGLATGSDGRLYVLGGNPSNATSGSTSVETYRTSTMWVTAPSMPLDPSSGTAVRAMEAATGTDGKTYAVAGNNGATALGSTQVFDPATGKWTATTNMMVTIREDHAAVAGKDGLIYAIGGQNGQLPSTNIVEAFDPKTGNWSSKAPMNSRRTHLAGTTGPDGRIYAIGGDSVDDQFVRKILDTAEVYDPNTGMWTTITHMPTPRDSLAAATGPDGLIYAFGGKNTDLNGKTQQLPVVEAYDPKTNSWSTKTPLPRARDTLGAVTGLDGLIYVFGGSPAGSDRTVDIFNPSTNTWVASEPMINERRAVAAALGSDGRIYAIGGNINGTDSNTVEARRNVTAAAAITSGSNTTFTVGVAGTFTVTATGAPMPTLSESGALPSGVTFTAATGKLAGTPVAGTSGTYAITFTAHNGVGADATQNFTLTVNKAPTSSTVSSSLNPSKHGNPVTFTATVKSLTTGTPTGSVTFKDGTTTLGTGTLSSGKATFTTSTLAVGTHSITAVYGGDANFTGSTSPALKQTVNP